MSSIQSVVIAMKGQSQCRVIVPAFEPAGDDVIAESLELLRDLARCTDSELIASIHQTKDVTDVEIQ
jgi:hypothetical protein